MEDAGCCLLGPNVFNGGEVLAMFALGAVLFAAVVAGLFKLSVILLERGEGR